MEQRLNHWIAVGYAHDVAAIILGESQEGELDELTLIEAIVKRAEKNLEEREHLIPNLTEEQVTEAIDLAVKAAIDKVLHSLTDKELIKVGIDESGEIVYSLTEVGKIVSEELKKKENPNQP